MTPTYAIKDGRYSYTHVTGEVFDPNLRVYLYWT